MLGPCGLSLVIESMIEILFSVWTFDYLQVKKIPRASQILVLKYSMCTGFIPSQGAILGESYSYIWLEAAAVTPLLDTASAPESL